MLDHHGRQRRGRAHHREPGVGNPSHWFRDLVDPLRMGRPSVRRGDVRPAILAALQESSMHGYQVIQELEARSGGRWRPSAGSVYPTLQQLEDEGLVRSEEVDGRRTYTLTDEGRRVAVATPVGRRPAFDRDIHHEAIDLRKMALQLVGAAIQVSRMGSPEARQQARDILVDSRRRMYRLLADDDDAESAPTEGESATSGGAA
ncbi:MAG TPA: PadR family transcriptional regulator [Candidatus Limnocylindrales bacterium]|jgi:DNA-binding PadR family transcriptional regulator